MFFAAKKATEELNPFVMSAIFGVVAIGMIVFWVISRRQDAERSARIREKYPPDLAKRIEARQFWVGMTASQLRDALGDPLDTDDKAMKTKSRQVWKYRKTGKNQYGLRITLDDGAVASWDQKK